MSRQALKRTRMFRMPILKWSMRINNQGWMKNKT
jgi:hypothetical protein